MFSASPTVYQNPVLYLQDCVRFMLACAKWHCVFFCFHQFWLYCKKTRKRCLMIWLPYSSLYWHRSLSFLWAQRGNGSLQCQYRHCCYWCWHLDSILSARATECMNYESQNRSGNHFSDFFSPIFLKETTTMRREDATCATVYQGFSWSHTQHYFMGNNPWFMVSYDQDYSSQEKCFGYLILVRHTSGCFHDNQVSQRISVK